MKERFTALFHYISTDLLEEAFDELKKDAAPGVDRVTWADYEADLEDNLAERGAHRALPSRRVYPQAGWPAAADRSHRHQDGSGNRANGTASPCSDRIACSVTSHVRFQPRPQPPSRNQA
jgi:hypothetical protein